MNWQPSCRNNQSWESTSLQRNSSMPRIADRLLRWCGQLRPSQDVLERRNTPIVLGASSTRFPGPHRPSKSHSQAIAVIPDAIDETTVSPLCSSSIRDTVASGIREEDRTDPKRGRLFTAARCLRRQQETQRNVQTVVAHRDWLWTLLGVPSVQPINQPTIPVGAACGPQSSGESSLSALTAPTAVDLSRKF